MTLNAQAPDHPSPKRKRLLGDQAGLLKLLGDLDDAEDMFAVEPSGAVKAKDTSGHAAKSGEASEMHDDAEGFLVLQPGHLLSGATQNYKIAGIAGKGMYSTVFCATSIEDGTQVAIKVLRNNPATYGPSPFLTSQRRRYRAGMKELGILNEIFFSEEQANRFVAKLMENFEIKGHLCLVFEALKMNLRELLQKYGKGVGLKLSAVQIYARQAFAALAILKKRNIVHADIKPDNILVSGKLNAAKICDFGTAFKAPFSDLVPYLASRFYRAPEIILGLPLGCELDVWSLGCTLFELATDRVLFPGRNNSHMLALMMEIKGRVPPKMIRKSQCGLFDNSGSHELLLKDLDTTGSIVERRVAQPSKPIRPLKDLLSRDGLGATDPDEEGRLTTDLVDLMEKCLELDPERRISPKAALGHPFLRI